MLQISTLSVAAWTCVVSDTILSHSVAGKLFRTSGPLYAKLRRATDVCTLGISECSQLTQTAKCVCSHGWRLANEMTLDLDIWPWPYMASKLILCSFIPFVLFLFLCNPLVKFYLYVELTMNYVGQCCRSKFKATEGRKWKTETVKTRSATERKADLNRHFETGNKTKNSSGDEIANVNFLRRYRTYVLQNTKKREPTSFNQLDDS